MRKLAILGAMVTALAFPATSKANGSIGVRIGYAPAMGDAFRDSYANATYQMSDGIKSQVPIQFDLGFAASPQFSIGGYFSYGFGQIGGNLADECDYYNYDCSAQSVRLGVQGLFALGPGGPGFVPWIGFGVGYEWAGFKEEGWGESYELKASGPELNFQLGGDWRAGPKFSFGPYLMLSIGRYTDVKVDSSILGSGTVDIDETAHEWLGFGFRGKFDF